VQVLIRCLFGRLLAAALAAALPLLGCLSDAPLEPTAGVPQYEEIRLVAVPGGFVNTAGGNLFVRRVDVSADTMLGRHEVAAVYNSASGEWLWSFEMTWDGETFLDPTGFVWRGAQVPQAGFAFEGSVWTRLDDDTLATKGGLVHHFDAQGRLASIRWRASDYPRLVLGADGIDQCVASEACTPVFRFTRNADGRPLTITEARSGRVASFGYDGLGRLASARSAFDAEMGLPGTRYEYSAAGTLLTAMTSPEGERIEYQYQAGRRILFVTQIGEENPRHRFDFYGRNGSGWPTVHTNPLGGATRYVYDSRRRLSHIVRDGTGELTRFVYAAPGLRPIAIEQPDGATVRYRYGDDDPTTIIEPSGNEITIEYEAAGVDFERPFARPVRRIDDSVGPVVEQSYDSLGRLSATRNGEDEVTTYAYHPGSALASLTGPAALTFRFPAYGAHGHWLEVEGSLEDQRAFDATGNLLVASVVGERGGILARSYDAGRHVSRLELAATGSVGEITATAAAVIAWRSDGRAAAIARPGGGDHVFRYDAVGRRVEAREWVDGAWQSTHYEYDAAGNLTARTRPNGMREEFDYDLYGRLTEHRALRDGSIEGRESLAYADGRLASRFDSLRAARESFGYDAAGRLGTTLYGYGERLTREYDLRSRLVGERFEIPGLGTAVDLGYAYDLANRRIRSSDRLAQETLVERRFVDGRLSETVTGNGLVRTRSYDADSGALVGLATRDAAGNPVELTDIAYSVEADPPRQQIRSVTDTPLARTTEEYWLGLPGMVSSPAGRVGKRVFGWNDGDGSSRSFAYDELGNRVDGGNDEFHYNDEHNRLLSATLADGRLLDYTYDAAGFATARNGVSIGWTATGRLASHGDDAFEWDLQGRLVSAAVAGVTRVFGWFGGRMGGDPTQGTLGALDLGAVSIDVGTGARVFRHLDFRGNVSFVSDDAGRVVSHHRYAPYGLDSVYGAAEDAVGFAGRSQIGELMMLGFRIYDPAAGRFLSPDPVLQVVNQFAYTLGNPVFYADPEGLDSFDIGVAIGEGAVFAATVAQVIAEGAFVTAAGAALGAVAIGLGGLLLAVAIAEAVGSRGSRVVPSATPRPAGFGGVSGLGFGSLQGGSCGLLGVEILPLLALLSLRTRRRRRRARPARPPGRWMQ